MDKYIGLYSKIYSELDEPTPMLFDCGELCSSACCRDNGKGMLLFPFEELFILKATNEFTIEDSNIEISGYKIKVLYCKGSCNRTHRPLACRIFPLFPFTRPDGHMRIEFDPRAKGICPLLLKDMEEIYVRGIFRLKILKAAYTLNKDKTISEFLTLITKELEVYKNFRL